MHTCLYVCTYLEVSKARTWRGERRREEIACSRNFQSVELLLPKQILDTRTCPNSALGSPNPFSWMHLLTSIAQISGGSRLSCDDFTVPRTRCSKSLDWEPMTQLSQLATGGREEGKELHSFFTLFFFSKKVEGN